MNQSAIEMFSTLGVGVLCIVLGIIALAIFFTVLGRISREGPPPETIAIRGILTRDTWAKVYMSGSEDFERVRFIGFTNTESMKTHLPYELNGMVILEDPAEPSLPRTREGHQDDRCRTGNNETIKIQTLKLDLSALPKHSLQTHRPIRPIGPAQPSPVPN